MFMRVSTQKRADGSTIKHYQLVESRWNPAKKRSTPKILLNFGRVDDPQVVARLRKLSSAILARLSPEQVQSGVPGWRVVNAWPYGDIYTLEALWGRLGMAEVVAKRCDGTRTRFAVERALFAMVANRAAAPCSKLYCYQQWLAEDAHVEGTTGLCLQHLYRAMDFLEANREEVEREIYFRLANLFNLDVDLIFYDTTSLHFEVDQEDRGSSERDTVMGSQAAGAKTYKALRKRGYPKNGRGDVPQIVVGLAVTRDGLPVRHWVFPGNTVDVTTVEQVKADLRDWKLSRCVFVGDAGMVSADNLRKLSLGGGKYIVCMPMTAGGEVVEQVLTRPGRYRPISDNLRLKEVVVGDGERRRRYVVCHNLEEAARQRAHRAEVLDELRAELESLSSLDRGSHSKRVCQLLASKRYSRYLATAKNGKITIAKANIKSLEKRDGKFVVHSNDDTLTAEDLALGYKQLMRVEQAWRQLKSGLRMRPVYHWAPHRIHAHVSLTVLALLLERMAEVACGDTWRNIRDDLKQVKIAQLSSPDGQVWQVTQPTPAAAKRLSDMKIDKPPQILAHA
jgi:hypothetical protein